MHFTRGDDFSLSRKLETSYKLRYGRGNTIQNSNTQKKVKKRSSLLEFVAFLQVPKSVGLLTIHRVPFLTSKWGYEMFIGRSAGDCVFSQQEVCDTCALSFSFPLLPCHVPRGKGIPECAIGFESRIARAPRQCSRGCPTWAWHSSTHPSLQSRTHWGFQTVPASFCRIR